MPEHAVVVLHVAGGGLPGIHAGGQVVQALAPQEHFGHVGDVGEVPMADVVDARQVDAVLEEALQRSGFAGVEASAIEGHEALVAAVGFDVVAGLLVERFASGDGCGKPVFHLLAVRVAPSVLAGDGLHADDVAVLLVARGEDDAVNRLDDVDARSREPRQVVGVLGDFGAEVRVGDADLQHGAVPRVLAVVLPPDVRVLETARHGGGAERVGELGGVGHFALRRVVAVGQVVARAEPGVVAGDPRTVTRCVLLGFIREERGVVEHGRAGHGQRAQLSAVVEHVLVGVGCTVRRVLAVVAHVPTGKVHARQAGAACEQVLERGGVGNVDAGSDERFEVVVVLEPALQRGGLEVALRDDLLQRVGFHDAGCQPRKLQDGNGTGGGEVFVVGGTRVVDVHDELAAGKVPKLAVVFALRVSADGKDFLDGIPCPPNVVVCEAAAEAAVYKCIGGAVGLAGRGVDAQSAGNGGVQRIGGVQFHFADICTVGLVAVSRHQVGGRAEPDGVVAVPRAFRRVTRNQARQADAIEQHPVAHDDRAQDVAARDHVGKPGRCSGLVAGVPGDHVPSGDVELGEERVVAEHVREAVDLRHVETRSVELAHARVALEPIGQRGGPHFRDVVVLVEALEDDGADNVLGVVLERLQPGNLIGHLGDGAVFRSIYYIYSKDGVGVVVVPTDVLVVALARREVRIEHEVVNLASRRDSRKIVEHFLGGGVGVISVPCIVARFHPRAGVLAARLHGFEAHGVTGIGRVAEIDFVRDGQLLDAPCVFEHVLTVGVGADRPTVERELAKAAAVLEHALEVDVIRMLVTVRVAARCLPRARAANRDEARAVLEHFLEAEDAAGVEDLATLERLQVAHAVEPTGEVGDLERVGVEVPLDDDVVELGRRKAAEPRDVADGEVDGCARLQHRDGEGAAAERPVHAVVAEVVLRLGEVDVGLRDHGNAAGACRAERIARSEGLHLRRGGFLHRGGFRPHGIQCNVGRVECIALMVFHVIEGCAFGRGPADELVAAARCRGQRRRLAGFDFEDLGRFAVDGAAGCVQRDLVGDDLFDDFLDEGGFVGCVGVGEVAFGFGFDALAVGFIGRFQVGVFVAYISCVIGFGGFGFERGCFGRDLGGHSGVSAIGAFAFALGKRLSRRDGERRCHKGRAQRANCPLVPLYFCRLGHALLRKRLFQRVPKKAASPLFSHVSAKKCMRRVRLRRPDRARVGSRNNPACATWSLVAE